MSGVRSPGSSDVISSTSAVSSRGRVLLVYPTRASLRTDPRENTSSVGVGAAPSLTCGLEQEENGTLTKNSPAKATGAHISILGHITRDELVRYLDTTEMANGFANRFFWFCARRSKCLPDGGQLNELDLQPLRTELATAIHDSRKVVRLRRDPKASELWHSVYGEPALRSPSSIPF